MWHQARKQEKKLRCLMVDYKKRAERRRNYYELCKKDPCSFLRLQGSNMRIHIDPAVASAAEGPRSMMAWNGDPNNLIDRFDVRAHLDAIPEFKRGSSRPNALEVEDDMRCNYDRYRIIVQNECAKISEEAALKQIEVDEKFGDVTKHNEEEKKALASKKSAIGFSYEGTDSGGPAKLDKGQSSEEEEDDFEDVDLDIAFDIDQLSSELKQQLDVVAITYGMAIGEFAEQLTKDKEDEKELRAAKIAEEEKAAMSGRKSRKERRLYKETMLRLRGASPPRYHPPDHRIRGSPTYNLGGRSRLDSDSSRSPSPVADNLEFITNLGGEDEVEQPTRQNNEINLPPHLRVGATSSASTWKQRRMRSQSPSDRLADKSDLTNQIVRKQLSPPPPVVKSYRRVSLEMSDSDELSEEEKRPSQTSKKLSNDGSRDMSKSFTANKSAALARQERMKRKMRSAINRTYKEDKRTTAEKQDQMRKEQQERAEEIRLQAEELRRKDLSRRRSSSSDSSRSRSRDRSLERRGRRDYGSSGSRREERSSYSRDYRDRQTDRYAGGSRESRDRYRDSHRTSYSGRRSYSRSPTRRRYY